MQLNPNHRSMQLNKVERVLERLFGAQEDGVRKAFNELRRHKDFVKEMLKRLMDKKYNQMRVAFWILRMKNRQKR